MCFSVVPSTLNVLITVKNVHSHRLLSGFFSNLEKLFDS